LPARLRPGHLAPGRPPVLLPAAVGELEGLLRAAEQILARTGDAVVLCPHYGTAVAAAPAGQPDDAA